MQIFNLSQYMVDMVYQLVPNITRKGNNQLNFRCPLCGDGKKKHSKRGHWYINQGTYYCWNGGCIANGKGLAGLQFLSKLTGRTQYQLKTELIQRAGNIHNALSSSNSSDSQVDILFGDIKKKKNRVHDFVLDGDWCELPPKVMQYVQKRKLYKSPFINKDWQLYYDKKKDRLVIPWTKQYYQLRALTKKQQSLQGKYLFPPEVDKPIFGLQNIDTQFKYLFLLQGVFDAIWVKNGLAVGSLLLSQKQKKLLQDYSDYCIVYFMDNQHSDKSSKEQTIKLSKQKPFQNMFIWPKELKQFKDVNDTIICSDQFIRLWSNQKFLTNHIANGIKANMLLR